MRTDKTCTKCGVEKPLAQFHRRLGRCRNHARFDADCQACADIRLHAGNYRAVCKTCAPKSVSRSKPTGPPRVMPASERKHACPTDIRRAFARAQSRHLRVATRRAAVVALRPTRDLRPEQYEDAERAYNNADKWLSYSLASLDSIIEFAVERRAWRAANNCVQNEKRERVLQHLLDSVDEWKAILTVRYAESGRSEAFGSLRDRCSHIIDYHVNRYAYACEKEQSASRADEGVLKAIEQWTPLNKNLARFSTYAQYKIMRATQPRKDSDTRAGIQKDVDGSYVYQVSADKQIGDSGTAMIDLMSASADKATEALDVRSALAKLPFDLAVIAQAKLLDGRSLIEISKEQGVSYGSVRTKFLRAKALLRDLLADHNPTNTTTTTTEEPACPPTSPTFSPIVKAPKTKAGPKAQTPWTPY